MSATTAAPIAEALPAAPLIPIPADSPIPGILKNLSNLLSLPEERATIDGIDTTWLSQYGRAHRAASLIDSLAKLAPNQLRDLLSILRHEDQLSTILFQDLFLVSDSENAAGEQRWLHEHKLNLLDRTLKQFPDLRCGVSLEQLLPQLEAEIPQFFANLPPLEEVSTDGWQLRSLARLPASPTFNAFLANPPADIAPSLQRLQIAIARAIPPKTADRSPNEADTSPSADAQPSFRIAAATSDQYEINGTSLQHETLHPTTLEGPNAGGKFTAMENGKLRDQKPIGLSLPPHITSRG